ncbi:site-specific integrase [Curtobacterium sp. MCSS17_016]|uniref:tyrosine-type recombinase/integrase n=1 Tax=Curtobacterium sp. MCSS17_016 TaxID=2175644 RepID=UPI000DA899FF|nr:site-specific integrase [Curtobacterium sp. MCSS17_016]WIE79260.1 tyrosine-type recombinase/integrase [Curtobacterium sp. MCSS17_016]
MGTIKSYETKTKGRLWEVWYTKPDGTRGHDRGFRVKKEAEAYLSTVEVSKLKGSYIDPSDTRATIAELGTTWLELHRAKLTESSFHSVESSWRVHVEPRWGRYAVGRISKREVQVWLNELGAKLSHTSVARARDLLAGILDDAIEENRVLKNPARGLTVKKKPIPDEVFLTHAQVEVLASEARYSDLVRFLAYTGLRWGEATALRVRNVDVDRRRANIREAVTEVNGQHVLGGVKSHERRSIAFPEFLDAAVAAACDGKHPDERLWSSPSGGFLRPGHSQQGWFAQAVKRAMAEDPSFRRVTPHDLRHTAASLAISAGANVKVVQRMLGHKSAKVTLDTYAALFPDDLDNLTAALSRQRADQLLKQGGATSHTAPESR